MFKIVGLFLFASITIYAVHAFAQVRADLRSIVTPVASSSSNGTSFAWFYDSTDQTVFACRMGPGPGDNVECKAKTALR